MNKKELDVKFHELEELKLQEYFHKAGCTAIRMSKMHESTEYYEDTNNTFGYDQNEDDPYEFAYLFDWCTSNAKAIKEKLYQIHQQGIINDSSYPEVERQMNLVLWEEVKMFDCINWILDSFWYMINKWKKLLDIEGEGTKQDVKKEMYQFLSNDIFE